MPVKSNLHFDAATAAVASGVADALEDAANEEKNVILENWDSGQDATGKPWTPLAPATIAQTGPKILVDTGDMRSSVYAERTGPLSAVVGVSDGKAAIHEYGTETIPPRPILAPAKTHLESGVLKSALVRAIGAKIALLSFGVSGVRGR